jgi:hypothetical protein
MLHKKLYMITVLEKRDHEAADQIRLDMNFYLKADGNEISLHRWK